MMKLFYLFIVSITLSITANTQSYEEQFEKCSGFFKNWSGEVDSSYFAHVAERDSCLVGSTAPDFTATSIEGEKIELSKLKGQVVVLNFWFTKCKACIEEMPALNKLTAHYANKKVKFISFAPEDADALRNFFQKHPFKFTAIAQSENIRQNKFRLCSFWPYTVLIDKQGKIARMWSGKPSGKAYQFYKKIIDTLL